MAELEVKNRELELKAKMAELEELKHKKVIEAIEAKIEQIKAIDTPYIYKELNTEKPKRTMGFVANLNQEEIVKALYAGGEIKEGDKVISKTKIIDVKSRTQDRAYKEVVKKLSDSGAIEFKRGYGYYAKADYETALKAINGGV
jgi:DNA-binding transcriptional regulator YhcF (GntR family)